MTKGFEMQRFCDVCNEWRTVRVSPSKENRSNPYRRCRKHFRMPNIGARYTHPTLGYVLVVTTEGQKYEHRVVWEQHHGPIPDGYHVHHINHVKDDNRIENLELVHGRRHNREHTQERHADGSLDARGRKNAHWRGDLDNAEIVRRREAGESYRAIGRDMSVDHMTIRNHYLRAMEGLA